MPAWCRQVVTGSPHASTVYVQWPGASGVTSAPQRSVPGASSRIGVQGPGRPVRVAQHDVGGDRVVALAEHGGGDLEGLAHDRLGRAAAAVDERADVQDGDAPDGGRPRRWRGGSAGVCGRARGLGVPRGDASAVSGRRRRARGWWRCGAGVGGADEWCVAGMTAPVRVNVGGRMDVGRGQRGAPPSRVPGEPSHPIRVGNPALC